MRFDILRLFCVLLLTMAVFPAKPVSAESLTLEKAVELATKRSDEIKISRAQADSFRHEASSVGGSFYPSIDISETYVKTDDPMSSFGIKLQKSSITENDFYPPLLNYPDSIENWHTRFSIKQSLFAGGQTYYGYKSSAKNADAGLAHLEHVKKMIRFEVTKTWFDLWLATRKKESADTAILSAIESEKNGRGKFATGLILKSDLQNLTVIKRRAELAIAVAENNRQYAIGRLAMLTGIPDVDTIKIVSAEYLAIKNQTPAGELIENAIKRRGDYKSALLRKESAGLDLRAKKGSFLPQVNLLYSRDLNGNNFGDNLGDSQTIAVKASLNIFSGGADRSRILKAGANFSRAGFMADDLRKKIVLAIKQADRDLKNSFIKVDIAKTELEIAKEKYEDFRKRFHQGAVTAADLLAESSRLENFRLAFYQAQHRLFLSRANFDLVTAKPEMSIKEITR